MEGSLPRTPEHEVDGRKKFKPAWLNRDGFASVTGDSDTGWGLLVPLPRLPIGGGRSFTFLGSVRMSVVNRAVACALAAVTAVGAGLAMMAPASAAVQSSTPFIGQFHRITNI